MFLNYLSVRGALRGILRLSEIVFGKTFLIMGAMKYDSGRFSGVVERGLEKKNRGKLYVTNDCHLLQILASFHVVQQL